MACTNCDQFHTEVQIHSPGQFVRIAEKIRKAVTKATLLYNTFESDREMIGQPSFLALTARG